MLKTAVKRLPREPFKYLLLGLPVVAMSAIVAAAFTVRTAAARLVAEYDPFYRLYGAAWKSAEECSEYGLPLGVEQIADAEAQFYRSNGVIFFSVIIGALLMYFAATSVVGSRLRDAGIYYALGFRRSDIFVSIYSETALFIAASSLAGVLAAMPAVDILYRFGVFGAVKPALSFVYLAVIPPCR